MGRLMAAQYGDLKAALAEIDALSGLEGLMQWDMQTMMPPKGAEARARSAAALAGVLHARRTDKKLGAMIDSCGGREATADKLGEGTDEFDVANVRRAAEAYERTVRIPEAMAKREAELENKGHHAWVEARKASDVSVFMPVLKEWVDLVKERSALVRPGGDAYDTAMHDFERGLTSARVDEIFAPVGEAVSKLVARVRAAGGAPVALRNRGGTSVLVGEFDEAKQAELCKQIALDMGFSLDMGRLDVSAHPFTGGADATDVRMTTRYKAEDLSESITGTIHETGHALYEQGRNAKYAGQPVSAAHSMGVHESQSLLWERMVGLRPEFSAYLLPKLQSAFPEQFADVTPEELHASFNIVKTPSLIRVEADELTYPLHVILRYEIERGLVNGTVSADDVPSLWNKRMKELLGDEPPDDAKGCLQDVHWSAGAFGYFPTYLLGAMYAAQIYATASESLPGLEAELARGEFGRLKAWLNANVHALGSKFDTADELLVAVTGKPLDAASFLAYLESKYARVYGL